MADNGRSIAQAHFSENAWTRAIYADEKLVGFVMLHIGADHDDCMDFPGAFLWRFMIAGPHRRKGYGEQAIAHIARDLKARGFSELRTSYGREPGKCRGLLQASRFRPDGRGP